MTTKLGFTFWLIFKIKAQGLKQKRSYLTKILENWDTNSCLKQNIFAINYSTPVLFFYWGYYGAIWRKKNWKGGLSEHVLYELSFTSARKVLLRRALPVPSEIHLFREETTHLKYYRNKFK